MSALPSPCTKQCQLDEAQTCTGCHRTIEEIRLWSKASEEEKAIVWQRLLTLQVKSCQRCNSTFNCGSSEGGCWCMDYPPVLSPAEAKGDCYCPSCLAAVIAERNHYKPLEK